MHEYCQVQEVRDQRRRDRLQKELEKKKNALSQMSMQQLREEGRRLHEESQTVFKHLMELCDEDIADTRRLRTTSADDAQAGTDEISWNIVMENFNTTTSIACRALHRMTEREQWRDRQEQLNQENDAWLTVWREAGHSCSGIPGEDNCRCCPSHV